MLTEITSQMDLSSVFVSPENFSPFPVYEDREAWARVSADAKTFWIAHAEKQIDHSWPAIKMSSYMDTTRTGNISDFLDAQMERRSILGVFVMAECLEGKGRFIDQIVNGIYAICEETSWMQPLSNTFMRAQGHCLPESADHVVDLAASETAALLAWTSYLYKNTFDQLDRRINERISLEVRTHILIPYQNHEDYWWHGFKGSRVNNWNPWCNGNVLMCLLILEKDQAVREQILRKAMRSLDVFIGTHSPDGCCDEGPMYWSRSGGSLYDCLELLDLATAGKINVFQERIIQDIGRYIYKVHIHDEYFVDFADGDARVRIPADVVFGFGRRIGDDHLIRLGASSPRYWGGIVNWFPLYRYLRDLFQEQERSEYAGHAPYVRDSWMDHAQVMTAREHEGTPEGFFVAAKGGHNLESHNHNDVGNFIVYVDGLPLIIDLGTEEYTSKTFSPQRFDLWYLQSTYHNLPTVNGAMQHEGKEYTARSARYRMDDQAAELSLDIGKAYPPESGIADWQRTVRLNRGLDGSIDIDDDFHLNKPAEDLYFSMMTVSNLIPLKQNAFLLEYAPGKRVQLDIDQDALDFSCEAIDITDRRLSHYWGKRLFRVVLKPKQKLDAGHFRVTIRKYGM